MSVCPTYDTLDHLVSGELPADDALPFQRHLASCANCRREVEWMRAERTLMAARARARHVPRAHLLAAVQSRRLAARHRLPVRATRWFPLAVGALCAALVTGLLSARRPPSVPPDDMQFADALMSIDHREVEISRMESELSACLVATPDLGKPCLDICL